MSPEIWGPSPLLYEMYGGGVITGTYTSKVMNMSMLIRLCMGDKIYLCMLGIIYIFV